MISRQYNYLLIVVLFSFVQLCLWVRINKDLSRHILSLEEHLALRVPLIHLQESDAGIHHSVNDLHTNTIPVFYNLYVNPNNRSDVPRIHKLVTEQLSMLSPARHAPIYVHSIGHPIYIPNSTLLGHHTNGTEMITLHSLWKYCRNHTNDNVLYLHSKGSYHDRHENDLLRSFLTFGAVECTAKISYLSDSIDVCSSRFSPYPHPHTSGNMWMARCSYVSKLISPHQFVYKMENVPRAPGLKRRFQYYLVGRQRFAAEHWIYSHPTVRPWDVYSGNFSCGYSNLPDDIVAADFNDLVMAPRFPYKFYRPLEELKPWTGLKHRWKEYQVLYNETPTKSWWGWKVDEWRIEAEEDMVVSYHPLAASEGGLQ
jgi:hypothetical protein